MCVVKLEYVGGMLLVVAAVMVVAAVVVVGGVVVDFRSLSERDWTRLHVVLFSQHCIYKLIDADTSTDDGWTQKSCLLADGIVERS